MFLCNYLAPTCLFLHTAWFMLKSELVDLIVVYMQIIWYGQSFFQIITVPKKGEQVSIGINPFSEKIGLKIPKIKTDIMLISNENGKTAILGKPFLIDNPGEYEIKEIFIQGIFSEDAENKSSRNVIYTIETEDIRICFLGDLNQKELTAEQLETIGNIHILMCPIGGESTLSAKEASKIISQIEPNIVIPMLYKSDKHNEQNFKDLRALSEFVKVYEAEPQAIDKLNISRSNLPEEMELLVLNQS